MNTNCSVDIDLIEFFICVSDIHRIRFRVGRVTFDTDRRSSEIKTPHKYHYENFLIFSLPK